MDFVGLDVVTVRGLVQPVVGELGIVRVFPLDRAAVEPEHKSPLGGIEGEIPGIGVRRLMEVDVPQLPGDPDRRVLRLGARAAAADGQRRRRPADRDDLHRLAGERGGPSLDAARAVRRECPQVGGDLLLRPRRRTVELDLPSAPNRVGPAGVGDQLRVDPGADALARLPQGVRPEEFAVDAPLSRLPGERRGAGADQDNGEEDNAQPRLAPQHRPTPP